MKPDIIDENLESINADPDDKSSSEIVSDESWIHHLLINFWSSKDSDDLKEDITNIKDWCGYFVDSITKVIDTDKGTLAIIDIPVDCLFEIDDNNNLAYRPLLTILKKVLALISRISFTPIVVSFIKKDNMDKYCIFHQERIYKEEISDDKCHIFFDKINEFIKENEWNSFPSICDEIKRHREKYVKEKVTDKEYFTIKNLSSSKDIPQTAKDLMANIIKTGRSLFLTQYDCLLPYHEEDPLPIPIFLKSPEDMPNYKDIWSDVKDKDKDKYIPQGKVLGYYTRKENEINYPHIVLCPENIEECSGEISVDNLYSLVLVHEMSHAILDRYYEYSLYHKIYNDWNIEKVEYWPNSLYSKAMEESLANMMALIWIKNYDDLALFDQCLKFISNQQPAIYQFGIYQYLAKG